MRKSSLSGRGLFAKHAIQKGEVIVGFEGAPGTFIDSFEADRLYKSGNDLMIQIDDDLFFAATTAGEVEKEDHINHSCDPNCGIQGLFKIVAMRDIKPKEEITLDYAMSESSGYEMKCRCKNKNCRRIITGADWQKDDLHKRYKLSETKRADVHLLFKNASIKKFSRKSRIKKQEGQVSKDQGPTLVR